MPNWCDNSLYLKADDEQSIHKFLLDFKKDGDYGMKNFFPIPEELLNVDTTTLGGSLEDIARREALKLELKSKYGYGSWYDFCVSVWGTKWDIRFEYELEGGMNFSTPWGPPCQFLSNISKFYPDIEFTLYYLEPGMMLAGVYSIKNDVISRDETYGAGYEEQTEAFKNFIIENEDVFGSYDSWFDPCHSEDENIEDHSPPKEESNYAMEL